MPSRVLVLDTSVVCCLLQVPGKETAGPANDQWTFDRISELLVHESGLGATFVLPIGTLIETGNHIANSPGNRFALATQLADMLRASVNAESPWATFADQSELWTAEKLLALAATWPAMAAQRIGLADATITAVAEFYALAGMHVQIVTGDAGLKAYEPAAPGQPPPRRRQ